MHLVEIEERRLHLEAGFSSMFEFCLKRLGLSEGEAFRRLLAARLGRRFPSVLPRLASGAVHLSALQLLAEHLTDDNHEALLEAASGKSKRELELLLAERFPKPDARSSIRKLPAVEPLGQDRFKVQFTAGAALRDKLELALDLMSHTNPKRELGPVIERALELLVAELQKRKHGQTPRPQARHVDTRPTPHTVGGRRRVTNAARREAAARDGLRRSYVAPAGRRCEARAFLELDHIEPRALGGGDEVDNLRLRCHAHNQRWAEQCLGRDHVARRRNFRQEKPGVRAPSTPAAPIPPWSPRSGRARSTAAISRDVLRRATQALVRQGFRSAEVRDALSAVEYRHRDAIEPLPLEQVIREALLAVGGA